MGFTVRFMLGTVLCLLCCWSIVATQLVRPQRQISDNGDGKSTENETERTTQHTLLVNLSGETSGPRTDLSTEDNKTIDKQSIFISKLQKSESYKKATNPPETKNNREEIGRSIDIAKYISKEFHSKNNVYNLPLSPDTQKYGNPDTSTHNVHEHTNEFNYDSELTTPRSDFFDNKYKEAVESVEQKLEHIDDSHEVSAESESNENINLEKLYEQTKNNDTKADLNFINYKNITSNNTKSKNKLHKDLVVEAGTNLDFRSSYNKTIIIDENDERNNTIPKEAPKKEISTTANPITPKADTKTVDLSTTKDLLTTRKSIVLTKPPSNKNSSHISILSNNIETETVKTANSAPSIPEYTRKKSNETVESVSEDTEVFNHGRSNLLSTTEDPKVKVDILSNLKTSSIENPDAGFNVVKLSTENPKVKVDVLPNSKIDETSNIENPVKLETDLKLNVVKSTTENTKAKVDVLPKFKIVETIVTSNTQNTVKLETDARFNVVKLTTENPKVKLDVLSKSNIVESIENPVKLETDAKFNVVESTTENTKIIVDVPKSKIVASIVKSNTENPVKLETIARFNVVESNVASTTESEKIVNQTSLFSATEKSKLDVETGSVSNIGDKYVATTEKPKATVEIVSEYAKVVTNSYNNVLNTTEKPTEKVEITSKSNRFTSSLSTKNVKEILPVTSKPDNVQLNLLNAKKPKENVEIASELDRFTSSVLATIEKLKDDMEPLSKATTRTVDFAKRGSTKYADTTTQSNLIPKNASKASEQLLQENQIVPVHVEPPWSKIISTTQAAVLDYTTTVPTTAPTTSTVLPATTENASSSVNSTKNTSSISLNELSSSTESALFTDLQKETTLTSQKREDAASLATESVTETTTEGHETTTMLAETITATITTRTITETETSVADDIGTTVESAGMTHPQNKLTSITGKNVAVFVATENVTELTTELDTNSEFSVTTDRIHLNFKSGDGKNDEETSTDFAADTNRGNFIPKERKSNTSDLTSEGENTTETNTITSDSFANTPDGNGGTIAAITISTIGAVCLILLAGLLVIMRKRQKRFNYGQRCTPVSLDNYSMDNISVQNSVRRKGMERSSKRSYGNPAFEDPVSVSHPLNFPALAKFSNNVEDMKSEFEEIPQITARTNELPEGCDTKNRYANVIPLPETRVFLTPIDGYLNSDYINANYVTGPKNVKGYYIACQAPMQNTLDDFWRMIWEQQSKVILMLTHLFENGVEKCVDYLPPSEVLDCHRLFGDFQITLKKREVKDKYIISSLQLKNMVSNSWREVTHFWYLGWPEKGAPTEANSLIAFLIEARSYMKSLSIDKKEVTNGNMTNGVHKNELNPVVVHCSPGTGRTGVVIACDIAIREFEQTRLVDLPRIVYKIRRDRASSVQTKEQYAFIYKVINLYATKLTGGALDSL